MAKRNSPGCVCCGGGSIIIYGCNSLPLTNYQFTVTTTGGVTVATGTTTSSGGFSFSTSGTFVLECSNFANYTFTSPLTANITLSPASGYVCCNFCAVPLPPTLHMTDGLGNAVVLTYNSTGGYWEGCETVSGTIFSDSYCNTTTGTIAVDWKFFCVTGSGGTNQLEQTFLIDLCGSTFEFYPSTCPVPFENLNPKTYSVCATDNLPICYPFSIGFTFTNPQTVCGGGVTVPVPVTGSCTVTF